VTSSPSLSAFRHRNYRLFFGGQLISLTGTWMQPVAESWLVYRLTGSSALLGVSSFASLAPVFLRAPRTEPRRPRSRHEEREEESLDRTRRNATV